MKKFLLSIVLVGGLLYAKANSISYMNNMTETQYQDNDKDEAQDEMATICVKIYIDMENRVIYAVEVPC